MPDMLIRFIKWDSKYIESNTFLPLLEGMERGATLYLKQRDVEETKEII